MPQAVGSIDRPMAIGIPLAANFGLVLPETRMYLVQKRYLVPVNEGVRRRPIPSSVLFMRSVLSEAVREQGLHDVT